MRAATVWPPSRSTYTRDVIGSSPSIGGQAVTLRVDAHHLAQAMSERQARVAFRASPSFRLPLVSKPPGSGLLQQTRTSPSRTARRQSHRADHRNGGSESILTPQLDLNARGGVGDSGVKLVASSEAFPYSEGDGSSFHT